MVEEARKRQTEHGSVVTSEGWFVLHVSEAPWIRTERFGTGIRFEGPEAKFPEIGVNLRVLEPGQPACLYHREDVQEDFFVIAGRALLVVEEEERPLRAGDFVHCPAGTHHVFVGAGDGPCAILMIGRRPDVGLHYPVSEAAARYGASVERATDDPREAYGSVELETIAPIWPLYGVE